MDVDEYSELYGTDKQHSNFGGLLTVAVLGYAKLEFEIRAHTKLNEGFADIFLDIREYIKENAPSSGLALENVSEDFDDSPVTKIFRP